MSEECDCDGDHACCCACEGCNCCCCDDPTEEELAAQRLAYAAKRAWATSAPTSMDKRMWLAEDAMTRALWDSMYESGAYEQPRMVGLSRLLGAK